MPKIEDAFKIWLLITQVIGALKPTKDGTERRAKRRYQRWLSKEKVSEKRYAYLLVELKAGVIWYKVPPEESNASAIPDND
jgi:hypothetical protein